MDTSEIPGKFSKGGFLASQNMVRSYVGSLAQKLKAEIEIRKITEFSIQFTARFKHIYLNAMDNVPCLLLTGDRDSSAIEQLRDFERNHFKAGKLPFVFLLNEKLIKTAREILPEDGYLFLDHQKTNDIFASLSPLDLLKEELRKQISLLSLNPYSISKPTKGNIFFGRQIELELLKRQNDVSFGIVGPSRIGKSSLANMFHSIRKKESAKTYYTILINCYEIDNLDSDNVAWFIAKKIESSKRAFDTNTEGLINFLRYCRYKFNMKLELILDEVDSVCETAAFEKLGEAAKNDICRLILCGKSIFFKKALRGKNPFEARLKFLGLKPLSKEESCELIMKPMTDLGFYFSDRKRQEEFLNKFHDLTGGMSHLIQLFCDKIIEDASVDSNLELHWGRMEAVKMDFTLAQYILSPLNDLPDEEARNLSWELFYRNPPEITTSLLLDIMKQMNISQSSSRLMEIRNDLIINNIIIWKDTEICLPNKALFEYARNSGFEF